MPRLKWVILELRGEEDIVTSIKKKALSLNWSLSYEGSIWM